MKKLCAMFLFVFMNSSFAVVPEIKDPSGLLSTIDTYLGFKSFEEAFMIEDRVWYQEKNCRVERNHDGSYTSSCEEPSISEDAIVEKMSDEIRTIKGEKIARSNYEQAHGNFLKYYFNSYSSDTSLSSFVVDMEKIAFEDVMVSGKLVKGIRAFYKINFCKTVDSKEECYYLPQEMVLGRNIPMLGQLLELVYHRETPEKVKVTVLQDYSRL